MQLKCILYLCSTIHRSQTCITTHRNGVVTSNVYDGFDVGSRLVHSGVQREAVTVKREGGRSTVEDFPPHINLGEVGCRSFTV